MTFYQPAGDHAVLRDIDDKLRESVSVRDFGAAGDGATNDTEAFKLALAYVESLPRGGEIYIPPGVFVMNMDLTAASGDFDHRLRIRGGGRGVTQIWPTGDQAIILNMLGRNFTNIEDLTIYAGDHFQAACGIYMSRSTVSGDCNGNKFLNVEVTGNFSHHTIIHCGAESALYSNVRIAPHNGAGTDSGFWAGSDPSLCGVTPPVVTVIIDDEEVEITPITGPCTDNRMIACETWIPFAGAKHLTFSKAVGFTIIGHSFIGGTSNNQRLVTYKDLDGGVFLGPVQFRDCHYEVFGTGNIGHYFDRGATIVATYWYGISSTGGEAIIDNNFVFVDFDRTTIPTSAPTHVGCTFLSPTLPYGITSGLPIYFGSVVDSIINWHMRDGNGVVVVLGTANRTPIVAFEPRVADMVDCDAPLFDDAVPTAGTFARSQTLQRVYSSAAAFGDPVRWMVSAGGTWGALVARFATGTSGDNHCTVSVAPTDIKIGEEVMFGSHNYRVAAISGSTLYFTTVLLTSPAGSGGTAAVTYSHPTPADLLSGYFLPIGLLGVVQASTVAAPAGGATVDTECRAQLAALLTSLKAAKVVAT